MKRQRLPMSYHHTLGYWLVIEDDTGYMMDCEKWFELYLGENEGVVCRLELGRHWYIVMGSEGVELTLRKDRTYKINLI